MGRGKSKKDPFEGLDKEFRSAIEGSDETQIRSKIAEVAIAQAQLMDLKEEDMDLAEKQVLVKDAAEQYTDGTKQNKLKIKFAKQMLESRGKL